MSLFRSQSKWICLFLLVGIFLLSFDFHADCEEAAQSPIASHHCCVQCCPSHNLGPVLVASIKMPRANHFVLNLFSEQAFLNQNPFLDIPYRPPIT